jgi:mRNA interferase MazF
MNAGDTKVLELCIVVPVTGWKPRWENNPFFVTLDPSTGNGLAKRSAVDCFQIRTLSHHRFIRRLGLLEGQTIDALKTAVALILDIEPEHCF